VSLPVKGIPGCEGGAWKEEDQPIERMIGEISVAVIVAGELLHRAHEREWYERWLETKKWLNEHEQKERWEAQRREEERRQAEEKARIDGLLAEAERFREAADFRAYVLAARAANRESSSPIPDAAYAVLRWKLARSLPASISS
jgi:hypothetical protein